MKIVRSVSLAAALLALPVMATHAQASAIFVGSSGSLAASAQFDIVGGNLQVVLTNTSVNDVLVPTDVLTALFFDIAGANGPLSRISALLFGGSTVAFGPDNGGNVGSEWAYAQFVGGPGGSTEGISSTGVGLFGPADNFAAGNLQGPVDVDGLQYGITSAGDNLATGNAAVTGGNALIKNSVIFLLGNLPQGFTLADISKVSFQYGTALDEPNIPGGTTDGVNIPEPGMLSLLGTGLAFAAYRLRRRA